MLTSSVASSPFFIKQSILPGVPTATVQFSRLEISFSIAVPPMKHLTDKKGIFLANPEMTVNVCCAISRVGERMTPYVVAKSVFFSSWSVQSLCKSIDENDIVFPVPDFACAIRSNKHG